MKKKKILLFNWKMNPRSKKEALKLFSEMKKLSNYIKKENLKIDLLIAPPAIYLDVISEKNKISKIKLVGQDIFYKNYGAYTGALSPDMLKDLGAELSIVGHWERRSWFNETNEDVAKKVRALLDLKMKAVICIGEEMRDREGKFADFLEKQLLESLDKVESFDLKNICIAYEPVWAIGVKGKKVAMEDLEQVIVLIKKVLLKKFGENFKKVKVLYGGSVNDTNIIDLSKVFGLDGFLLGRVSLSPEVIKKMIERIL